MLDRLIMIRVSVNMEIRETKGRYNWTMFDAASKRERHEKVFPEEQKKAFRLGAQMVTKPW